MSSIDRLAAVAVRAIAAELERDPAGAGEVLARLLVVTTPEPQAAPTVAPLAAPAPTPKPVRRRRRRKPDPKPASAPVTEVGRRANEAQGLLAQLVTKHGSDAKVAERLGLGTSTIGRIRSGLVVSPTTIGRLRSGLTAASPEECGAPRPFRKGAGPDGAPLVRDAGDHDDAGVDAA